MRPRSTLELVDAAIALMRRHYAHLLPLSAVVFAPGLVVTILAGIARATGGSIVLPLLVVLLNIAGGLWFLIAEAALLVVASSLYLGGAISPAAALRQVLRQGFDIIVTTIAKWAAVGAGALIAGVVVALAAAAIGASGGNWPVFTAVVLLGLVVAAAWAAFFYARYFAVPATVVLEGLDFSDALDRAKTLSTGSARQILLTLGLAHLIYLALVVAVLATGAMFGGEVVGQALSQLFMIVAYPVVGLVTTLLYYDLRIRKEGYDIELMARALGGGSPAGTAGA
jgi:hypothetical protein